MSTVEYCVMSQKTFDGYQDAAMTDFSHTGYCHTLSLLPVSQRDGCLSLALRQLDNFRVALRGLPLGNAIAHLF